MKKKFIIGNWKMNCLNGDAINLINDLSDYLQKESILVKESTKIILCPPAILINNVKNLISEYKLNFSIGGQDCSNQNMGAYTGDIACSMLADAGCEYVIIGHSERRKHHGEDDKIVCEKTSKAIENSLTSILCVGETLEEYKLGISKEIVKKQLLGSSISNIADKEKIIIAYEPVWAIGTGIIPSMEEIANMSSYIVELLEESLGFAKEKINLLYGGSVDDNNAKEILKIHNINGLLIGSACLNPVKFSNIIKISQEISS